MDYVYKSDAAYMTLLLSELTPIMSTSTTSILSARSFGEVEIMSTVLRISNALRAFPSNPAAITVARWNHGICRELVRESLSTVELPLIIVVSGSLSAQWGSVRLPMPSPIIGRDVSLPRLVDGLP